MGEGQPFNPKEFMYRVGTFFLLVAVGLFAFFFLSESAQKPTFEYFCWGTLLTAVGFFFRSQYKRPVKSSGRFSWWGKIFKGKNE